MTHRNPRRAFLPIWLQLLLGVLRHRPDRAIAVAYWYLTRRFVRARNRLHEAAAELLPAYKTWISLVEYAEFEEFLAGEPATDRVGRPRFSLVLHAPAWTSDAALDRTLASIYHQTCPDWNVIVTGQLQQGEVAAPQITHLPLAGPDRASALRPALATASGDFVIIVPPDAMLPAWALARYQQAAEEAPGAAIFYGDEDVIDDAGRRVQPWFKPLWNSELILAQDYMSNACAITTPLARAVGAIPQELAGCAGYALLLAATMRPGADVSHVAHVLCHLPDAPGRDDQGARLRAVARHVEAEHGSAEAGPFGTIRVRWPLPDPAPTVTIIVPTRDRVELLEACIGSLLRETRYPHYDVVVVDNQSVEPRTHAWFEAISAETRVSVLRYDHSYNYSAINNFAAARARGAYLCMLNNDTEIIDGAWLGELMRYATRPGVGAVGAKLLYDDRSIQHAGVVMGLGNAAGHAHRALPDDEQGYFALAHCAHHASAVTAACLVVERAKFEAVGGFDETHLQIAYNDVDLCLKLERAGWRNIYAPQAVLIHHESKSRGLDTSPQHVKRYMRELAVLQERWATTEIVDPMHHPRLDRSSETYRIRL